MALPTCVKCGNSTFEQNEVKVAGATTRKWAVNCAGCGGVVTIVDFHHMGESLTKQKEAIKAIAAKLGVTVDLGL
jgi:hypothetical protein